MKKILSVCLLFGVVSCSAPVKKEKITLHAAGSSFSIPLYTVLFKDYKKEFKQNFLYTPSNSYFGIQQIIDGNVDMALSDVFMTDQEINASETTILHIPIAAAGINFLYNIPEEGFSISDDPIYLDPIILYKIYTGQITHWNDPQIVALNKKVSQSPNRKFPNLAITPIYRQDPSGDTYIFSSFMSKAVPEWKNVYGISNHIPWKTGIGQKGSIDVIRAIVTTPGSLGYSTMIYGLQNSMPVVRIKNDSGTYVRGCNFRSLEAMKAAETNSDNRVDIIYPLGVREASVASSLMYILVRQEQNYNNRTKEQAQALVNFLYWTLSPAGQQKMDPLLFSPLTLKFRIAALQTVQKMTYNGEYLQQTKK